jgi:TatD DNase family protein
MPAGGVVHSFDGSAEDRDRILDLGLHIGINGCSLKTEENLAVVAGVPADRLMLETDCPWCEIRPSHAGYKLVQSRFEAWPAVDKKKWREGALVKGRNEPHNIRQVLEVVAAVRKEDPEQLAETVYANTERVFKNLA